MYKEEWIENKFISVRIGNYSLSDLLDGILYKLNLKYVFVEPDYLVLLNTPPNNYNFNQKNEKSLGLTKPLVLGSVDIGLDSAILSGRLLSAENHNPIEGAVITSSTGVQDLTSDSGYYSLKLSSGYNNISFKALGINDLEIEVILNSNSSLNLKLFQDFIQLEEVSVSATRPDNNVSDNTVGSERMTLEEIEKIPPFLGETDVIKSLSSLPGVSTSGETSSGFNVRGSSGSKNLILVDNAVIYNGGHLFGLFGSLNSEAIKSVELFKGTVPAKYGGRTSSVLNMTFEDGSSEEKITGEGGVGMITSRFSIHTPLFKGKHSFSSSFRTAYPNYLLNAFNKRELRTSSSFFGDLNLAYKHNFIKGNSFLKVSAYSSRDDFKIRDEIGLRYDNNLVSVNYGKNWSNNLYLDVHYSYSKYNYRFSEELEFETLFLDAFIENNKVSAILERTFFDSHDVKGGVETVLYGVNTGDVYERIRDSERSIQYPFQEAYTFSAFLSDRFTVFKRLDVLFGLRSTYFPQKVNQHKFGIDPRLSFNFKLNRVSSLKIGYNRSRQFIHLLSNTASITPIDFWRLSNENINPSVAQQVSLGYFRNFRLNNIETSVEGFYKEGDNFLDFKNGADLIRSNDIENEVIQGDSKAYGIEFLIKKKAGKFNGWLSYTWLRSFEKLAGDKPSEIVNEGKYFPTYFDQPHNLNALTKITISRRIDIALNFVYNSGRPITYPNSYYQVNGVTLANYPFRNNSRIMDYHRFDFSINFGTSLRKNKKVEANWSLILYNVYGRRNAYSVFFRTNQTLSRIDAFRLSIIGSPIPALSYNFKF